MAVSRRLRFEILRRDGYTCRYCGASAPDVTLTVDHVVPVALGGGDEPNNLVTACRDCNAGKSSIAPDAELVADVDATSDRWTRALAAAADQSQSFTEAEQRALKWFVDTWHDYGTNDGDDALTVEQSRLWLDSMPVYWRRTIITWERIGCRWQDQLSAIDTTWSAHRRRTLDDPWKYFCKVVWNVIGERQVLARKLIESGEID